MVGVGKGGGVVGVVVFKFGGFFQKVKEEKVKEEVQEKLFKFELKKEVFKEEFKKILGDNFVLER